VGTALKSSCPRLAAGDAAATISPMRTAVVSDLHLGALGGADLARDPGVRERLVEALRDADRVVLLGDALELRERPLAQALEVARPLVEALGAALAGRTLVVAPGNHDHALADPWLGRLRLDGHELAAAGEWPVERGDGAMGRLAAAMPEVDLRLAYPGLWLRPDVYATHGHYLDLDLTIPRLESIAASAMGRLTGRGRNVASAADYEAVLAPIYAFYERLAEGAGPEALSRGGTLSRTVWKRATGERRAGRILLGRVAIPGAVGALNRLGFGPFRTELTGPELRRAGLLAMGRVADALAPDAEHVVFGHTHRAGPLPRDDLAEWTTLSGSRLWNSGSWFHESAFMRDSDLDNPYLPGTVLTLDDEGPPRLENALAGYAAAATGTGAASPSA
jgi:predicted phosphodiesterase